MKGSALKGATFLICRKTAGLERTGTPGDEAEQQQQPGSVASDVLHCAEVSSHRSSASCCSRRDMLVSASASLGTARRCKKVHRAANPGWPPRHHIKVNPLRRGSGTAYGRRLAGIALIVLLSGLAACNRSPEVGAAPKPPTVTVVAVGQRSVPVYGQYVGQTEAVRTVEVRARVEGFIERQVVPDGATVKAGEVLFTIDPRPLEAVLRQAEANVARDTAALSQAQSALTQREADVQQAQANLERDLAQVENARTKEGR